MQFTAVSKPLGNVSVRKIGDTISAPVLWKLKNVLRWGFLKGWFAFYFVVPFANFFGVMTAIATLEIKRRTWFEDIEREHFLSLRREGKYEEAESYAKTRTYWIDYGVVSYRVITNNGVGFIVDAFQNLTELENMNYHGIGTNSTAEAAGDSALGAESTTALNPDNTRATGTQTEPASNQYRTTGTLTADGSIAVTEHGLFSASATGSGVLFDRSVFSTINLASADSLQSQYTVAFTAGG